jgi:hypothetical protein
MMRSRPRTSAVSLGRRGGASKPACQQDQASQANCATPDRGERLIGQRADEQQGCDQKYIEQRSTRGIGGETIHRVQHPAKKRNQRNEQQIRKRDARQTHHEAKLRRVSLETGRYQMKDGHRGDLARHHEQAQRHQQDRKRIAREDQRRRPAFAREGARKHRHESLGKGALGEQRAEQVGQAQGDEERIAERAGAEHRRGEYLARKAKHAADHGIATNSDRGPKQAHGRGV